MWCDRRVGDSRGGVSSDPSRATSSTCTEVWQRAPRPHASVTECALPVACLPTWTLQDSLKVRNINRSAGVDNYNRLSMVLRVNGFVALYFDKAYTCIP